MPVYVEISPLHRWVRRFAKIVEVAGAHLDLVPADIAQLALTLRGDPD